jgi:hypothetical protein
MLIIELRVPLAGEEPQGDARAEHEQRIEQIYEHLTAGVPAVDASAVAVEIALDPTTTPDAKSGQSRR